jgi:putative membrane protein
MQRALIVTAAMAAALSLAACQKTDQQPSAADPGTGNDAVNAAQDATSAAVGATSSATVGQMSTDAFVTNAAISDMYEIQAGEIAQKKGQSADVKAFGKMMVADHTALSKEVKPLAEAAGKTLPTGLDERRKGLIDNLNAANPAEFDKVYLAQQEAAHSEALTLMQGYADNGDDAGLKGAATKAVPKVQAHLDHVKKLLAAPAAAPAKK